MGDGKSINIWEDALLPGDSFAVVPTPNLESDAGLKVSDVMLEMEGGTRLR